MTDDEDMLLESSGDYEGSGDYIEETVTVKETDNKIERVSTVICSQSVLVSKILSAKS